jgi:uncharacterized protein
MQWTPGGPSDDLEDRRNESGGGGGFGGFGGGRLGLGGILIVGLLSLIFRHNFFTLFSGDSGAPATTRSAPRQTTPQEQTQVQFMSFVLDDAQRNWDEILPRDAGVRYRHAKLVLFRDAIHPDAAWRKMRPDRSIVRKTKKSISTWASSTS